MESFPREIFPPLPRTRIQRRRLREWSIYDQEINQIGFINSQLALIASDTVFSVSMQPWKHLTLICCWHEMSFTSRDSSERGDYLGSVVYAMLPRARPLWPHRRTMNSILKTLGNRKHPNPDPSLSVFITNQKENKVASSAITFTFNFGGFLCLLNRKQKSILLLPFLHHSALFQRPCWLFVMLSAWICCKWWWARSWSEELFYHFLWTSLEFVHEGLVFRMKRVVCYDRLFVRSWGLINMRAQNP